MTEYCTAKSSTKYEYLYETRHIVQFIMRIALDLFHKVCICMIYMCLFAFTSFVNSNSNNSSSSTIFLINLQESERNNNKNNSNNNERLIRKELRACMSEKVNVKYCKIRQQLIYISHNQPTIK